MLCACFAQRHSLIPRVTMHRIRLSTKANSLASTCSSQSDPKFRIPKGAHSPSSCSDLKQRHIHCRTPEEVHLLLPTCVEELSTQGGNVVLQKVCYLVPIRNSPGIAECRDLAPTHSSQSSSKCRDPKVVCLIPPYAMTRTSPDSGGRVPEGMRGTSTCSDQSDSIIGLRCSP